MDVVGIICFAIFTAYELTGLSRGGQQVNNCSQTFNKAIKLLVELASLQVISSILFIQCNFYL